MSVLTLPPCAEGEVLAGRMSEPCREALKPWVLAACVLGSSLAFLIAGGVNVALPSMQAKLGADVGEIQWILNAYMLALAALTLPMGAAGDRFGRRRLVLIGTLTFAAGSLGCGLSPGVWTLVACRLVQGAGAAMLVPNSLALLAATFPKEERGRAIGTWGAASALTTALGPAFAGGLTQLLSWRWVFFAVVPLAVGAWYLAKRVVPRSRDESAAAVDVEGAFWAAVGLGAATVGLINAGSRGWGDIGTLLMLGVGGCGLLIFLFHESKLEQHIHPHRHQPMMPLSLFGDRTFLGANVLTVLLYFGLMGAFFFVPFNLENVRGLATWQVGLAFLPFSLLMAGLSRYSGALADRLGPRPLLVGGPLVVAVAFVLLALPGVEGGYWTAVFPGMTVLGLGMAASVSPLTTTVMNSVPETKAGVGSGVNNALARVATLLAVAVLGAVAVTVFEPALASDLERLGVPADVRSAMLEHAEDLAQLRPPVNAPAAAKEAVDAAFIAAFRVVMWTAAACALAASVAALLLVRPAKVSP